MDGWVRYFYYSYGSKRHAWRSRGTRDHALSQDQKDKTSKVDVVADETNEYLIENDIFH